MCWCVCVGRGGDVASVNVCAANAKDVEQPVGVVCVCVCGACRAFAQQHPRCRRRRCHVMLPDYWSKN